MGWQGALKVRRVEVRVDKGAGKGRGVSEEVVRKRRREGTRHH